LGDFERFTVWLFVMLELPRVLRTTPEELLALRVRSGDANALPEAGCAGADPLVPLRELVTIERTTTDKSIYHKNLLPVTYIIGDVAGTVESPLYADPENERCATLVRYARVWRIKGCAPHLDCAPAVH
jgi:multidrug efflux pump subunit AcrB